MNDETQKIVDIIRANGWLYDDKDEYMHFFKDGSIGIDIGDNEVVFIDDNGDFAHIPLNYYAVVGFIFVHRIILPIIPVGA